MRGRRTVVTCWKPTKSDGSSTVVVIPKWVVEELKIEPGQPFKVSIEDGKIVYTPIK